MTNQDARPNKRLERHAAVSAVIGNHKDFLIIAALGGSAKDVGALTEGAPNGFLVSTMGTGIPIAFGLALAQPQRRVVCVTGDGDMLMSLGMLATIAATRCKNIAIVCVDNALYQETGGQVSHTGKGVDLAAMAEAAGFAVVRDVVTDDQIAEASDILRRADGPIFILLRVDDSDPPKIRRNAQAAETKAAFRQALLGQR
jgi:phosphonopyruvate decarboxylase